MDVWMHTPMRMEQAIITAWQIRITRLRSMRSDIAPANRLRKRQGTQATMLTKPTSVLLPRFLTNHKTAVICSQLPILEMKAPEQYIRKPCEDRALKTPGCLSPSPGMWSLLEEPGV